jgi:ubiquinone/menaquinone biosynthesis C-methylase UbiE
MFFVHDAATINGSMTMNNSLRKIKCNIVDRTARKPSGKLGVSHFKDPKRNRVEFDRTLQLLDVGKDDVFLDIACGGGILLKMALATVKRGWGIDHSRDMVETARQSVDEQGCSERGNIIYGSADTLPWPDSVFSCAAVVNAFYFFENPRDVLEEIRRVLKPGGRFVISNMLPPKKGFQKLLFKTWSTEMSFYSIDEMADLFNTAGFTRFRIEHMADIYEFYYGEKSDMSAASHVEIKKEDRESQLVL